MPEPTDKLPLKVFLCHAHADRNAVRALYSRLKREGVDAWLDKEKLLPGADWELEIRKAVRAADVVVVCLSKQFNQAGFRQKEVRIALDTAMEQPEGEIFIIPARLEECENLESLSKWHWVNLFEDDGYQSLIRALRARAERIGATLRIRRGGQSITSRSKIKESENMSDPFVRNEDIGDVVSDPIIVTEMHEIQTPEKHTDEKVERETTEKASREKAKVERFEPKKAKSSRKLNTTIVVSLIGFVGTIIAALLGSPIIDKWFSPAPAPTVTSTSTMTLTLQLVTPSQTMEPIPSLTPTITPTATLLPAEITDAKSIPMHLVSAGEFTMGYSAEEANNFCHTFQSKLPWFNPCRRENYLREEPVHEVYLNNFFMDVFEVSNEEYKKCVLERVCPEPSSKSANRYPSYYDNETFNKYPVLNITWDMAKTYCEWRDARLPTEAEWEKAARGTDWRTHPWGNFSSAYEVYNPAFYEDRANVNLGNINKPTIPVDSNLKGLSPYRLYNMAGNVAEWVADWYSENYYGISPNENPLGPSSGEYKVIRGGSVFTFEIRTSARDYRQPSEYNSATGIRCAKSAP